MCSCAQVSMSVFLPIPAKCLICIPPARIKGTPNFKYSKPCRIAASLDVRCLVSGERYVSFSLVAVFFYPQIDKKKEKYILAVAISVPIYSCSLMHNNKF